MIDCQIVVPSHNRAHIVEHYTLAFLDRLGIARDAVTFFVAEGQVELYADLGCKVVKSVPGLRANRNFIACHYPPGTKVLSLDDDLLGIDVCDDDEMKPVTPFEFAQMVGLGFAMLGVWHGAMWGVSPVHNDRWRSANLQVGAPLVEGCLYGFVSGRGNLVVPEDGIIEGHEDAERVCCAFKSGWNVVRLGRYVHRESGQKSGGKSARTSDGCEAARRLERLHPDLLIHRFGKLPNEPPCRVVVRPRRWVNDPESMSQVSDMRERIKYERPRQVSNVIHKWDVVREEPSKDEAGRRIENAIVELHAALNAAKWYRKGHPEVDALRQAIRKLGNRKPKRVIVGEEEAKQPFTGTEVQPTLELQP